MVKLRTPESEDRALGKRRRTPPKQYTAESATTHNKSFSSQKRSKPVLYIQKYDKIISFIAFLANCKLNSTCSFKNYDIKVVNIVENVITYRKYESNGRTTDTPIDRPQSPEPGKTVVGSWYWIKWRDGLFYAAEVKRINSDTEFVVVYEGEETRNKHHIINHGKYFDDNIKNIHEKLRTGVESEESESELTEEEEEEEEQEKIENYTISSSRSKDGTKNRNVASSSSSSSKKDAQLSVDSLSLSCSQQEGPPPPPSSSTTTTTTRTSSTNTLPDPSLTPGIDIPQNMHVASSSSSNIGGNVRSGVNINPTIIAMLKIINNFGMKDKNEENVLVQAALSGNKHLIHLYIAGFDPEFFIRYGLTALRGGGGVSSSK